jgi:hypothetical protein
MPRFIQPHFSAQEGWGFLFNAEREMSQGEGSKGGTCETTEATARRSRNQNTDSRHQTSDFRPKSEPQLFMSLRDTINHEKVLSPC